MGLERGEVKTVWVSKYALSAGIKEIVAEIDGNMAVYKDKGFPQYFHGDDFHLSLDQARVKAEQMRIKKIASLKKQIARLEKVQF